MNKFPFPFRLFQDHDRQSAGQREQAELRVDQGPRVVQQMGRRLRVGGPIPLPQGSTGRALHHLLRRNRRSRIGTRFRVRKSRRSCSGSGIKKNYPVDLIRYWM